MSLAPPTRAMRENPDLDQLKRQAKELLEDYQASSPGAVAEVVAYHRTATRETFALHDAQFVLARAYGFESWPKLRAAVDGVTAAKLHEAAESGAVATARQLLVRRPEIVDLGRGEMRALHMAVMRRDLGMTKLLLEFGADPDGGIWPKREATSPYVMARDRGYEEIEQYGGWIDPGSAGYARQTDIARRMLAGEMPPHLEANDFSGGSVAEQLLWGGASALSAEIVRMALEHIDWLPDDPRWFWMLWRPVPGHEDYNAQQQAECCECFRLILARCGPHHRASDYGQTMLHEVIARDHGVGVQLATILLDAGARLDVRDTLLESTPLGWACRWGRTGIVKLLLARGADPVETDAQPWATPRAWAERMHRPEILELLAAGAEPPADDRGQDTTMRGA